MTPIKINTKTDPQALNLPKEKRKTDSQDSTPAKLKIMGKSACMTAAKNIEAESASPNPREALDVTAGIYTNTNPFNV